MKDEISVSLNICLNCCLHLLILYCGNMYQNITLSCIEWHSPLRPLTSSALLAQRQGLWLQPFRGHL